MKQEMQQHVHLTKCEVIWNMLNHNKQAVTETVQYTSMSMHQRVTQFYSSFLQVAMSII